jgi:Protein of unknown function (DUF4043)
MAVTQTHINNQLIKWRKSIFREWRRGNYFSPYMGESPTAIIQVTQELKDGGDIINIPIVSSLRGPGVSTGPLTGNEEKLINYGMRLWVDWSRNAVLLTKAQQRKSSFEQLEVVRPLLTEWGNCLLRDEIVQAFAALPSEAPPANLGNEATAGQRVNGIFWDSATTAQKNKWLSDNSDRVLFGALKSNQVTGSVSGSLLNVDKTADKATAAIVLLAKRMARAVVPGITPYRDNEDQGREYFVLFCGQEPFRDLNADPVIYNANLNARPREGGGMEKNPIFQDGDLLYRGVIIREVPEISDFCTLPGAGAGGDDVQMMFLCGQNAAAVAWGQMPKPTERREDDYQFIIGRGVESVYGVGKVFTKKDPDSATAQLVQFGVVTIFVAAPADA